MIRATREERRKTMAESSEVRVTHEEVEAFVGKLRDFHGSLDESEQAMLGMILGSAQGGGTSGYIRPKRTEQESSSAWNDLIGWIEEHGDEDTQGFIRPK
jgi:hypothetical protein